MTLNKLLPVLGIIITTGSTQALAADNAQTLQQGKYLVQISGCNDCHTPGYAQTGGKVPSADWLTGSPVGFAGPWGVTYPKNLRIMTSKMSEDDWVKQARTKQSRPPMPWFTLRDMKETDLRAMYQYIRSLGKAGEPAPDYAPPGVAVNTPYIEFFPKNLPSQASAK